MAHDLVTGFLIWCIAGSLQWVVLDGLGVISGGYAARVASGRRPTLLTMVIASIAAIVGWPVFLVLGALHPKWMLRTLKRNLWGRP